MYINVASLSFLQRALIKSGVCVIIGNVLQKKVKQLFITLIE